MSPMPDVKNLPQEPISIRSCRSFFFFVKKRPFCMASNEIYNLGFLPSIRLHAPKLPTSFRLFNQRIYGGDVNLIAASHLLLVLVAWGYSLPILALRIECTNFKHIVPGLASDHIDKTVRRSLYYYCIQCTQRCPPFFMEHFCD